VDAVRNRASVVAAAASVFADRGLDASLDDVADRAGVGKATIYRSFPTKEHLVSAVACERLAAFEALARAALGERDAWAAFCGLLGVMAQTQASDRILGGALAAPCELSQLTAARRTTLAALERVMRKAQRQGTMRRDVTVQDVRVLFAGVAHMLNDAGEHDAAVWRRYAELITAGLRSPTS
jgi:AcrR family transcriptional regulator